MSRYNPSSQPTGTRSVRGAHRFPRPNRFPAVSCKNSPIGPAHAPPMRRFPTCQPSTPLAQLDILAQRPAYHLAISGQQIGLVTLALLNRFLLHHLKRFPFDPRRNQLPRLPFGGRSLIPRERSRCPIRLHRG